MNYRHAFHAGNFADVVKHALLCRLVRYLQKKEGAIRIFDTHAGPGLYDLAAEAAERTREYQSGIAALAAAAPAIRADPFLADYWQIVAPAFQASRYPGSPLIARRLLREQDRLSAYELHPEDGAALKRLFAGDIAVKAIALDGFLALGAHLPPKEKRGLVLIDPPFEKTSEIDDIVAGLTKALGRWRGGTYAVWYPIKKPAMVERLRTALTALSPGEAVDVAFLREPLSPDERFVGTGLFVINPPFVFADEAAAILSTLAPVLGRGNAATFAIKVSTSRPA
ncbi:23S rRNA (adenine(2030)-N(6))-methyltransferase RlmJ [Jiella sp. MQZ9-1]|uniref:Ribosomal RNA large subunit methyltransferase J n=1 Tax=Jiella flava TaxID=2816857 RepID=A0A939JU20_9HYPH|nr:23S rRNA (adenine(2030)-N(6))-methyltransferase RlmJ [Jiella flava]MBO0660964.1 23S rRNA (adenine(2030)-N(6))-methyltransferase RlmJ [Jiella flava]MCD2469612.1 23S rRNA (adenine(2030)-N(6))-methyltransferase RlmJ [Jiella flava]